MSPEEIFASLAGRVLFLTCDLSSDDEVLASGVLVSEDGFLVTNAHVIEGCRNLTATHINGASHRPYQAVLKYYDKKSDTAVLKIEGHGFGFFDLLSRDVRVGERVYAIGNPQGLEQSMSEGIVSGLRSEDGASWIQHSAPISQGSSGGALISSRGELLGINSWYGKESQNLNFAVPTSTLAAAYKHAQVLRGSLKFPELRTDSQFRVGSSDGASPNTSLPAPSSPSSEPLGAVAQYNLGRAYAFGDGQGVPQDDAKAAKWFRKAADQGLASAQLSLGFMNELGQGVPEDDVEAARWYRKAADQGVAEAQASLGTMYSEGRGVPRNYAKALIWYRKAADQGEPAAQCDLGRSYELGRGVAQDYVFAHMWYNLAASRSTGRKQKEWSGLRDSLAAKMTASQIAEAQRLAREWKPVAQKVPQP
jgi:TPR repeat protein